MKKLFVFILLLFSLSGYCQWTGSPSGVIQSGMRPLFNTNAAIRDSFGVGKMLLFDSAYVRNATMFQFKAGINIIGKLYTSLGIGDATHKQKIYADTIFMNLPPKDVNEDTVITFRLGKLNYYPASAIHVHYADTSGLSYNSWLLDGSDWDTVHAILADSSSISYIALQLGSAGNCTDAYIDSIYGCSPVVVSGSLKATGNVEGDTIKYTTLYPAIVIPDTADYSDTAIFARNSAKLNNISDTGYLRSTGDIGYNNYTFKDTVLITKGLKVPLILGGDLTTSDLTLITSTANVGSGADMQFLTGNNGSINGLTIGYTGNLSGLAITATTNTDYKLYFGVGAGVNATGIENTLIGYYTGSNTVSGTANTGVGFYAFGYLKGGSYNTAIGGNALYRNVVGDRNTSVGMQSGYNVLGTYNTMVGQGCGYNVKNSSNNTLIGAEAGSYVINQNIDNSIWIGYKAGRYEDSDNTLHIGLSGTPAIYGILTDGSFGNRVAINDTTANATLDVRGSFMNENTVMGNTLVLTNNTADTIFKITFPSDSATYGNSVSGEISYTINVRATDGTQVQKGIIEFAGTEYLGVVTTDIATDVSRYAESNAGFALTVTPALTYDVAVGKWYVKVTSNSTGTNTPVTMIEWNVINNNNTTLTNY